MKIIGIAGGIASGKSVVSARLESLGAFVLDADQIGHRVLARSEVIAAARQRWGNQVVDSQGQLVRSEIAARVFGGNAETQGELAFWESCTHPRITTELRATIERIRDSGEYKAVVLDAPVMFKAGWHAMCDVIVFVDTPRELRLARAVRRGWSTDQFEDREASQTSLEEKRNLSSFVIDNSGYLEQTYEQVLSFWNSLSL